MQLAASRTAQYLIQTEYHQVELQSTLLILSSQLEEEHIPFHVWNGEVTLKRGLLWGSIQFFAHEESGERHSWLVQGLPWEECREFVRHAIASYQRWHHDQCEQLNQILPNWEKELKRLTHLPSFLSHSQVAAWSENVFKGFSDIDMTLEEATQRMPNRMKALEPWLLEPESTLLSR
ncbi:DNA helicase IV, partial [Vibrio genomosp. F10 str. 9ZD137]